MQYKVFQKSHLLLILFVSILALSCKKEEPVTEEPVADVPTPSFTSTFSLISRNKVAGYQIVLANTTADTAGVTFTWIVPGAIQLSADTFFTPNTQTTQLTISLTAARAIEPGKFITKISNQTMSLMLPPPPKPTFTLKYMGYGRVSSTGGSWFHIIKLKNTTQDTIQVKFSCSVPFSIQFDYTDSIVILMHDTGLQTISASAARGGLVETATQQIYIPTPGFDITKGIFYQIPLKRPDGTDWNTDGTPPNQVLMMTDYHVTIGFMDAGNLPATHVFARTHNIPNSPALIDPHPDQYHEILYQYSLPGEAPVNYPTGIGFVPNDHRFAGTDSGYVELQNGLTHLKLWLKFTD